MKCPQCGFITSNAKDLCPKCQLDLRPHKKALGLPISNPSATVSAIKGKESVKVAPPVSTTPSAAKAGDVVKPPVAPKAPPPSPEKAKESSAPSSALSTLKGTLGKLTGAKAPEQTSVLKDAPIEFSFDEDELPPSDLDDFIVPRVVTPEAPRSEPPKKPEPVKPSVMTETSKSALDDGTFDLLSLDAMLEETALVTPAQPVAGETAGKGLTKLSKPMEMSLSLASDSGSTSAAVVEPTPSIATDSAAEPSSGLLEITDDVLEFSAFGGQAAGAEIVAPPESSSASGVIRNPDRDRFLEESPHDLASILENDDLPSDAASLGPNVLEFGEDDTLFEQQIDSMLGEMDLDITPVKVEAQKSPAAKAKGGSEASFSLDDDLEFSVEMVGEEEFDEDGSGTKREVLSPETQQAISRDNLLIQELLVLVAEAYGLSPEEFLQERLQSKPVVQEPSPPPPVDTGRATPGAPISIPEEPEEEAEFSLDEALARLESEVTEDDEEVLAEFVEGDVEVNLEEDTTAEPKQEAAAESSGEPAIEPPTPVATMEPASAVEIEEEIAEIVEQEEEGKATPLEPTVPEESVFVSSVEPVEALDTPEEETEFLFDAELEEPTEFVEPAVIADPVVTEFVAPEQIIESPVEPEAPVVQAESAAPVEPIAPVTQVAPAAPIVEAAVEMRVERAEELSTEIVYEPELPVQMASADVEPLASVSELEPPQPETVALAEEAVPSIQAPQIEVAPLTPHSFPTDRDWDSAETALDSLNGSHKMEELEIGLGEVCGFEPRDSHILLFDLADEELEDPEKRRHLPKPEKVVATERKLDTSAVQAALATFHKDEKRLEVRRQQAILEGRSPDDLLPSTSRSFLEPASKLSRAVAWMTDGALAAVLGLVFSVVVLLPGEVRRTVFQFSLPKIHELLPYIADSLGAVLVTWLVLVIYATTAYGQTIGQKVLGIWVTDIGGNPPTLSQSVLWALSHTTTFLTGGIGTLLMFGRTSQSLPDRMAGVVISRVTLDTTQEQPPVDSSEAIQISP